MGSNQANRRSRRESGQAAVESALVLPLSVFLILGSIQLFLMHQARIMTEYAAFRATRAGSVNNGDCDAMNHAALAALLPTFRKVRNPTELGKAFNDVKENRFSSAGRYDTRYGVNAADEEIVWIFREKPTSSDIPDVEDRAFDARFNEPMQLQITMVYWYPMRIPFADWVIYRMAAANMGIESYLNNNPLMPTADADWTDGGGGQSLIDIVRQRMAGNIGDEMYLFPIQATHSMRMMTPAKRHLFSDPKCFN